MTIGRIVDISSNQHPSGTPIDWAEVAKAGVTTVIIKATQGTTYTNPWYARDVAGAQAAGLDVLAYHFAEFTDVAAEVAHFRSVAGKLAQCLDIETSENVPWSRTFLQGLELPPAKLLIYGSASSLRSIYAQLPAMAWVAAYQAHSPGWGVLWQFTSSAAIPGIPGQVDQSNWQGSEIQYDDLFGIYDPTPAPSPPTQPPTLIAGVNDHMITVTESATDGNRHVFVYDETDKSVTHWYQSITGGPEHNNFAWTREVLPGAAA